MLSRFMKLFVLKDGESEAGNQGLLKVCNSILSGFVFSGLLIVIATGFYQLGTLGMSYMFQQGWFHMKLTIVLVLIALTVYASLTMSKASRGENISRKSVAIIHGVTALSLILILLTTYIGRVA